VADGDERGDHRNLDALRGELMGELVDEDDERRGDDRGE
jgi:hypothetical protein